MRSLYWLLNGFTSMLILLILALCYLVSKIYIYYDNFPLADVCEYPFIIFSKRTSTGFSYIPLVFVIHGILCSLFDKIRKERIFSFPAWEKKVFQFIYKEYRSSKLLVRENFQLFKPQRVELLVIYEVFVLLPFPLHSESESLPDTLARVQDIILSMNVNFYSVIVIINLIVDTLSETWAFPILCTYILYMFYGLVVELKLKSLRIDESHQENGMSDGEVETVS